MIILNQDTQKDFLNREWVQRLLDAGVDMSDAKYFISKIHDEDDPWINPDDKDGIFLYEEVKDTHWVELHSFIKECVEEDIIDWKNDTLPTYTVSELLCKLGYRHGMYTIFNCVRNSDIDNVPIIESLALFLIKSHNEANK